MVLWKLCFSTFGQGLQEGEDQEGNKVILRWDFVQLLSIEGPDHSFSPPKWLDHVMGDFVYIFIIGSHCDHHRVGTWCVGGIESKPDTLDVLLYNEVMSDIDEWSQSNEEGWRKDDEFSGKAPGRSPASVHKGQGNHTMNKISTKLQLLGVQQWMIIIERNIDHNAFDQNPKLNSTFSVLQLLIIIVQNIYFKLFQKQLILIGLVQNFYIFIRHQYILSMNKIIKPVCFA